jgi:hypothetical protein
MRKYLNKFLFVLILILNPFTPIASNIEAQTIDVSTDKPSYNIDEDIWVTLHNKGSLSALVSTYIIYGGTTVEEVLNEQIGPDGWSSWTSGPFRQIGTYTVNVKAIIDNTEEWSSTTFQVAERWPFVIEARTDKPTYSIGESVIVEVQVPKVAQVNIYVQGIIFDQMIDVSPGIWHSVTMTGKTTNPGTFEVFVEAITRTGESSQNRISYTVVSSGGQQPPSGQWSFDIDPISNTASPGGTAQFYVYVYGSGQRIQLWLAQFDSFGATFLPNDEHAPYTSIMTVHVDSNKPPGTYALSVLGNNLDNPVEQYSQTIQLSVVGSGSQFTVDIRTDKAIYSVGDPVIIEFLVTDNAEQGAHISIRKGNDPNQELYFNIVDNPTPGIWHRLTAIGATPTQGSYTVRVDALNLLGQNPEAYTTYSVVSGGSTGFDFSLSLTPLSHTLKPGDSKDFQLLITYSNPSFMGTQIDIQTTGLGSGMQWQLDPATKILVISTSSTTPEGIYTVVVNGSALGIFHQTTATLVVSTEAQALNDFSITPSPAEKTITTGESSIFILAIEKIGNFNQPVAITNITGIPSNVDADLRPEEGMPNFTTNLTISTYQNTAPGTYNVSINVEGGGKTHSASVRLKIEDKKEEATSIMISVTAENRNIFVSGSISPSIEDAIMDLIYTGPNNEQITHKTETNSDGSFTDRYQAESSGTWIIIAEWMGDKDYSAARSQPISITIGTSLFDFTSLFSNTYNLITIILVIAAGALATALVKKTRAKKTQKKQEPTNYCINCGKSLKLGQKSCDSCGEKIE